MDRRRKRRGCRRRQAPGGGRLWAAAGRGADDRHAARGARLRRALARLSGAPRRCDRLGGLRLFARRLRPVGAGRTPAPARLHDARGLFQPAHCARGNRLQAWNSARAQRRRVDRGDLRRRAFRRPRRRPRPDRAPRLHRGAGPGLDCGSAPRLCGGRPARQVGQIPRRCRRRVLRLERRLARSLVQGLEHRGRGSTLARPGASDPGRRRSLWNAGADPRDRSAIARAG